MGASYLAGLATGFYKDKDEIKAYRLVDKTFEPSISRDERDKKDRNWQRAIARSFDWAKQYEE